MIMALTKACLIFVLLFIPSQQQGPSPQQLYGQQPPPPQAPPPPQYGGQQPGAPGSTGGGAGSNPAQQQYAPPPPQAPSPPPPQQPPLYGQPAPQGPGPQQPAMYGQPPPQTPPPQQPPMYGQPAPQTFTAPAPGSSEYLLQFLSQRMKVIEFHLVRLMSIPPVDPREVADLKAYVGTSTNLCNFKRTFPLGPGTQKAVIPYDSPSLQKYSPNITPSFNAQGKFIAGADGVYLVSASGTCTTNNANNDITVDLVINGNADSKLIYSYIETTGVTTKSEQCAGVKSVYLKKGMVVELVSYTGVVAGAPASPGAKIENLTVCFNLLQPLPSLR